ncbi:MAG: hypothetical protein DHS80DRAFT_29497 [Piptocephalis tieghemiana]|nr:MAG: hypothetical protein DHS80DRAFT_29497 [Piptocephalis tieghemiana]
MEPNPFEASFAAVSHTPPNSGNPEPSPSTLPHRTTGKDSTTGGHPAVDHHHHGVVSPKASSSPPNSSSTSSSGPLSPALLDHPLETSGGSSITSMAPVPSSSHPGSYHAYTSRADMSQLPSSSSGMDLQQRNMGVTSLGIGNGAVPVVTSIPSSSASTTTTTTTSSSYPSVSKKSRHSSLLAHAVTSGDGHGRRSGYSTPTNGSGNGGGSSPLSHDPRFSPMTAALFAAAEVEAEAVRKREQEQAVAAVALAASLNSSSSSSSSSLTNAPTLSSNLAMKRASEDHQILSSGPMPPPGNSRSDHALASIPLTSSGREDHGSGGSNSGHTSNPPSQPSSSSSPSSSTPAKSKSTKPSGTKRKAPSSTGKSSSPSSSSNKAVKGKAEDHGKKKDQKQDPPLDEAEKRRQFLERNRQAALKCRQRKKEYVSNLQAQVDDFSLKNSALTHEVTLLREECLQLKTLLLAHRDCPIAQANGLTLDFGPSHPSSTSGTGAIANPGSSSLPGGAHPISSMPMSSHPASPVAPSSSHPHQHHPHPHLYHQQHPSQQQQQPQLQQQNPPPHPSHSHHPHPPPHVMSSTLPSNSGATTTSATPYHPSY